MRDTSLTVITFDFQHKAVNQFCDAERNEKCGKCKQNF